MSRVDYEANNPFSVSKGAASEKHVLWGDTNFLLHLSESDGPFELIDLIVRDLAENRSI